MNVLAPMTQNLDMVNKAYVDQAIRDLDISSYAKASELEKKVDKVTGKGLSENDYTTAEKNKLASLENYDDTEVKNDISKIAETIAVINEWYEAVGSKFTKESDGSVKMTGDFFTTGQNSAGDAGQASGTAGASVSNLVINFTVLRANSGKTIGKTTMSLIGLSDNAVENILDAQYNKVKGNGTYREVYSYNAWENANSIHIYLMQGDMTDSKDVFSLDYNKNTQMWSITNYTI